MNLRPYQARALAEVDAAFAAGKRRVLLVMPTAAGKTVCFAEAARRRHRATIIAHRRELLAQARRKAEALGLRTGPIQSAAPIRVASIQSLQRRLDQIGDPGLLIADEAHHCVSDSWLRLFRALPGAPVLGVTATPERLDGRGLGDVFQAIVRGPSIPELIESGYLSSVRVYAPPAPPDLTGVRTLGGDYSAGELAARMAKPKIIGDAVEHYGWHTPGAPAIAFCPTVDHARLTAEAFSRAGWRARAVWGGMPDVDRDAAIEGLETGEVEVVVSCSLIDEGLDVPALGAVIDLAPSKSLGRWMQRVGRGFRTAPGKTELVLLDHAGNTLRHGLPGAPREWSLGGRPKRQAPPAVRQCGQCYAMHTPAPRCPCCGHLYAETGSPRPAIRQEAGFLEALSPEDRRLRTAPLKDLLKEAQDRAGLERIAAARGYKPGWVNTVAAFRLGRGRRARTTTAAEDFA